MNINMRLREVRIAQGLTVIEFAKRLGVSRALIHKIEKSERSVSGQLVSRCCEVFKVDSDYIWGKNGTELFNLTETESKLIRLLRKEPGFIEMAFDLIRRRIKAKRIFGITN